MSRDAVWIVPPNFEALRPGFYRGRVVRGGIFVPIRFEMTDGERDGDGRLTSDQVYALTIDGELAVWTKYLGLTGEPIDAAEYDFMCRTREFDRHHGTNLADARKPIDPLTAPLPF